MKLRETSNTEISKQSGLEHPLLTNIVEEKLSKSKIRATLATISKTLCGTLGPYGSTTIIQDRALNHFATKDGYDLMNRISFNDQVAGTILDIVRQTASNQVRTVGDGSTSVIVVANALYSALTDEKNSEWFNKIAPKDILDMLNTISEIVEKEIVSEATPIKEDDYNSLEKVAVISTNNDAASGKLIREIYEQIGKYGFITTEISGRKEKDEYTITKGVEWKFGYIDDAFVLSEEADKIVHERIEGEKGVKGKSVKVFITNSALTGNDIELLLAPLIGQVCGKDLGELVIVANSYDEDVRNFLIANRTKHRAFGHKGDPEIVFTAVHIDQVTRTSKNKLKDLALLLGTDVYDKFEHTHADFHLNPSRFIGEAEKAIITSRNTQIIPVKLTDPEKLEKLNYTIEGIIEQLKELEKIEEPNKEEDAKIYEYRSRLGSLKDSIAIIQVGGKTQAERMTRERLFEDAIFSTKSALETGVITGGNLIIPRILNRRMEELVNVLSEKYFYLPFDGEQSVRDFARFFLEMLRDAFLESYRNVLLNSYLRDDQIDDIIEKCSTSDNFYNLKTHKYETSKELNVINSSDTDIQIMRSCVSIIGIIATSNQVLTIMPSLM